MIKYKIEGEYLDQFDDKTFAVTKAISKIGEIDLRHGDRSTEFEVPLTSNNARILRYTPELNHYTTINNFDKYNGQLIEDDAVISDGYYQVTKFNPINKKVNIRFYGGNSNWFDLLKDRYINIEVNEGEYTYQLDDTNHRYSDTNVVNSWDGKDPYFYFIRDNGENSTTAKTTNFSLSDFGLSYYQSFIFQKIFDSVNINLRGNLFNDYEYNNTVITSDKDVESVIFKDDAQTRYKINEPLTVMDRENLAPSGGVIPFNVGGQNTQWNNNIFTAENNINDLRINFILYVEQPNGATPITGVDIYVSKNGGAFQIVNMTFETINQYFNGYTYSSFGDPNFINIVIGDTFEFKFFYKGADTTVWAKGEQYSYVEINEIGVNGQVNGSDLIPKIKQTDFIKDVMFRSGVISQYDVKTRTLTLDKFETIENNIPYAPDLTSIIDLSKDIVTDFTKILSGYAKKSVIEYVDDSDNDTDLALIKAITGEGLGNGIINIDNDFLSDEKSIYESPFSATANRWTFDYEPSSDAENWYVPFIPTKKANGEDNEITSRILLANKLDVEAFNRVGTSSISIDFNGSYSEIGYGHFTKSYLYDIGNNDLNNIFDNLMFTNNNNAFEVGDTLLQKNYNLYSKILNAPFYVSMYMNLKALDMQQVDFLTPIYLAYEFDSGYYYIDSIEQYKGDGTSTKINLVKI